MNVRKLKKHRGQLLILDRIVREVKTALPQNAQDVQLLTPVIFIYV